MFSSGIISLILTFSSLGKVLFDHKNDLGEDVEGVFNAWVRFPMIVLITSIVWIVVTFLTPREGKETLRKFYKRTQPGGPGWKRIRSEAEAEGVSLEDKKEKWSVPSGILAMILGCILVYGCMFATGNWIYGNYSLAGILTAVAVIAALLLKRVWNGMKDNIL